MRCEWLKHGRVDPWALIKSCCPLVGKSWPDLTAATAHEEPAL
jgi:hypothetical protein